MIRHWACLCEDKEDRSVDEDMHLAYVDDKKERGRPRPRKTLTNFSNQDNLAPYFGSYVLGDIIYSLNTFLDDTYAHGVDEFSDRQFVFDLLTDDQGGRVTELKQQKVGTVTVSNPKQTNMEDVVVKLVQANNSILDNGAYDSKVTRLGMQICSLFKNGIKFEVSGNGASAVVQQRTYPISLKCVGMPVELNVRVTKEYRPEFEGDPFDMAKTQHAHCKDIGATYNKPNLPKESEEVD